MEFLNENEITKELIERTLENLEHYRGDYDVVHLLNSSLGLLIIPKERQFEQIASDMVSADLLSRIIPDVRSTYRRNGVSEPCNLMSISRHIRNAICHGNMAIKADRATHIIDHIIFTDNDPHNREYTFSLKMNVELFREFVIAFSEGILRTL